MLVRMGAKPTDEMLDYAVHEKIWFEAKALIAGGAKPDEHMLKFAIKEASPYWVDLLVKEGVKVTPDMLDAETLFHVLKQRPSEQTEMMIRLGAKPTDEMLGYAVHEKLWFEAKALIAGGAAPDEQMLDHAKKNLGQNWVDMLQKPFDDNQAKLLTEAYNKAAAEKKEAIAREKIEIQEAVKQMQRQLSKPASLARGGQKGAAP